jgi:uncharacterized protein
MAFSMKPTIRCQQKCKYCYEGISREYNAEVGEQEGKEIDQIIAYFMNPKNGVNSAPNLHGGEPLMIAKDKVEQMLKAVFTKYKESSIQTNGALITKDHIRMFKEYKTHVGVSIDGHEELNDGRWMGTLEATRSNTAKILKNIEWMMNEGISVGIISVINKHNAAADRIPKLKEFLLWLKSIGIKAGRLNMIELDFPELRDELALTEEEAIAFHTEMPAFLKENDLTYAPFTDVVNALLGFGHKTCVTTKCDPYHTLGEQPIYGDGTKGNCLRTTKDGVVFLAEKNLAGHSRVSNERYAILRQIPMNEGGCGGCRYWSICSAHCPGSAEDGDWRNKTEHCKPYYAMYESTEKNLKQTMPMLKLTTELNLPGDQVFNKIQDGTASELVFERMFKHKGAF